MGPWGIAALVAMAAIATESGRDYLKRALKMGLRAGYSAKKTAGEFAEKAKDYKNELVAEIKAERDECLGEDEKVKEKSTAN